MDDAPAGAAFRVRQDEDTLILRRSTGSLAGSVFLGFWLCGWSAGCVWLTWELIAKPASHSLLFLVPFWAGWLFGFVALVSTLFGYEEVRLGEEAIEVRTLFGWRTIPIGEVTGAVRAERIVSSGESLAPQPVVRLNLSGEPLDLGAGLRGSELDWLVGVIREHLRSIDSARVRSPAAKPSRNVPAVEVLGPASGAVKRPSDSRIEQREDWDGLTFTRRGRFRLSEFAGLTLIMLFWDSIVGVFLLEQFRNFSWFVFFFMMPHEFVGLAMIVAWLGLLIRPLRAECWTVSRDEVAARSTFLGVGRTRRRDVAEIGHIEICREEPKLSRPFSFTPAGRAGVAWTLALVGRDWDDVLAIGGLTEGEARWLGGEFRTILKESLRTPVPDPRPEDAMFDRWLDA